MSLVLRPDGRFFADDGMDVGALLAADAALAKGGSTPSPDEAQRQSGANIRKAPGFMGPGLGLSANPGMGCA
jgi:hypothetical protein